MCRLNVRNRLLFDLMLMRTRSTELFASGIGYELVRDQCGRWSMTAPPELFDTLL